MAEKQFKVIVPGEGNGGGDQCFTTTLPKNCKRVVNAQTLATAKIRELSTRLTRQSSNSRPNQPSHCIREWTEADRATFRGDVLQRPARSRQAAI